MGTRNLTMIIHQEKTKVAQYGQWDGYPSGQGATILEFLKTANLNVFKEKLKLVRFQTKEDEKELDNFFKKIGSENGWMTSEQADKYHKHYPLLTRDNGAKILQMLYDNNKQVFVNDSSDFGKNGLMCEFAYVLDLDNEILECYKGFSKRKQKGRFCVGKPDNYGYYGCKLMKKYSFKELPTVEKMEKDVNKQA